MKKVKIIGLTVNKQLGILKACRLAFDENNKLIIIKGAVGEGKTTLQKTIQLGTQGTKTLVDKKLYGEVDTETQLMDGDLPVYVGCKSDKNGSLIYSIYIKDANGKIVTSPVIDGVSATPAKYLDALQTELTWKMDELCSENPTTQRNILLQLYKYDLAKLGVIFDSKSPEFKNSILGKIENAEKIRNHKDAIRKELGGIKEDLEEKGFFVDRLDTLPIRKNIDSIIEKEKELEKKKTTLEVEAKNEKQNKTNELIQKSQELVLKAVNYNNLKKDEWDKYQKKFNDIVEKNEEIKNLSEEINLCLSKLSELNSIGKEVAEDFIRKIELSVKLIDNIEEKKQPKYIPIKDNKIIAETIEGYDIEAASIIENVFKLREEFVKILNENIEIDFSEIDKEIEKLKIEKENAQNINKICDAVDSFNNWREANEDVLSLKSEYHKLLKSVNTGVEGLQICDVDGDLFLMYDGSFDPKYFNNPEKELRKLSSYSGTQKPVICLLIQNYLLSLKPKAMRYMYIDNVPIDNKTRLLLEDMCDKLDITVFLNITGDFDHSSLKDGEILIEGGEVFFNE